jgi:predicted nucleic acid-binding protein
LIFVDTSFWVALAFPRDDRHSQAARLLALHDGVPFTTTNHVRGEAWTLLRRRVGHRLSIAFLVRLNRTRRLQVVFVSEPLEREALRWLRRHDERPYSFVDATSFALMRSLRIREAFAFDGDFSAAGFVELRP